MDASLGNGDGLLFHRLVDGHLIFDVHLVEFVNAADAVVCKHQGACLDAKLASFRILANTCRQTSSIARFSATVYSSSHKLADVL